jgi:hypothetical protein
MDLGNFSKGPLEDRENQQVRRLIWRESVREEAEKILIQEEEQKLKNREAWRFGLTIVFPFLTTIAGGAIWLWGWLHGAKP